MNPHQPSKIKLNSPLQRRNRHGALAVEFAMTAGIAIGFFFASFEFCRVAMIRHTVDNAVYEGARTGIIPGATSSEVENKAKDVLKSLGLTNSTVVCTPQTITDATNSVNVEITVPIEKNAFGTSLFFKGKNVKRSLTMLRETAG